MCFYLWMAGLTQELHMSAISLQSEAPTAEMISDASAAGRLHKPEDTMLVMILVT